jgi:hypothetical protein
MIRLCRLSTHTFAIFAATLLTSLALITPQTAIAGPFARGLTGGYYYGGGYGPGYGGYSGYGYSPYGYGGYSYVAPRAYVYPSSRYYDYSPGIGTAGTYHGMVDHRYGGSRPYGQTYGPFYSPYGYGSYGGFGF